MRAGTGWRMRPGECQAQGSGRGRGEGCALWSGLKKASGRCGERFSERGEETVHRGYRLALLAILICQSLWLVAESAVYRWVDDAGRVQFGDRPPLDEDAQRLKLRSAAPGGEGDRSEPQSAQQRHQARQKLLDAYRDEREEKQKAEQKRAAEIAQKKRRCVRARDRLRNYERSSALYKLNPDGSRRFLSSEQFEAALAETRGEVRRWCKQ